MTPIEDDVTPEHYAVPILAREIKTASRYNYFNSSELSRFAWKISRLGFKTTAQKISWLLKEPLNGYPINLDTEFEEIILINGSKNKPFLISGRIEYDNHWKFDLKRGLSKTSQDKLLDDIALSSLHDFRLRRLLKRSRFEYFEILQVKEDHFIKTAPDHCVSGKQGAGFLIISRSIELARKKCSITA